MRIGNVVGTITLNRQHPSMQGARLLMVEPLSLAQLRGEKVLGPDTIVVYDQLGAAAGHRIMISEGREAALPFAPAIKPVDAYNAGILDRLDLSNFNIVP